MITKNRIKISWIVIGTMLALLALGSNIITAASPDQTMPTPTPDFETASLSDESPPPAKKSGQSIQAGSHTGNGPFGPATSNDMLFTLDSAATLDEYRYRSESPIEFTITVDRVVGRTDSAGYLLEPDQLIQNGIVSAKGHLQLLVWDVDEDYSGTEFVREIDKVYLNGHYIGNLSGANETWSVSRLDFDVRYLKFAQPTCGEYGDVGGYQHLDACHTAPTPVQNTIRIDIDTGNTTVEEPWAVEVDWSAISFEAARPILFVHGKGGSNNGGGYDYWDKYDGQYYFNFRGKFSADGFLTAITENRLGGEAFIAENASRLKLIISELKTRYGVRQINIVAHSKGGLDSRGYISDSSLNSANDVAALVTLASPHHGSYLADVGEDQPKLAGLLGNPYTDAVHDLTEIYVNETFNPSHPARQGVRYYAVAADAGQDYWYGRDIPVWQIMSLPDAGQRVGAPIAWLLLRWSGEYKGENDFMVTLDSARWDGIPGHSSNSYYLGTYNLNHHSVRAAERQVGEEDATIANLVKGVLDIKSGSSGSWMQTQVIQSTSNTQKQSSSASNLGILDGSIAQGQILDQSVGIDSTTYASFSLLWQNGDLYLNLVAPDGTVITPSTTITTVAYAEDRTGSALNAVMSGKACIYNVVNPQPGQWMVQVAAATTLPDGYAEWVLLTTQDSPVALSLTTDQSWHKLNDVVTLAATVMDGTTPLLSTDVRAVIVAPSGITQSLTLLDNGLDGDVSANDGVYSNQFTAIESGTYRFSADAVGTTGGIAFRRTALVELPVGSAVAAFGTGYSDYGVDTTSDGLYDILRINVPVNITTTGQYGLMGVLYDSENVEMGRADTTLSLTASNTVVPLDFDGNVIAAQGGQGAFILRDVRLIDKSTAAPLQVDFLSDACTTQNYSNAQFQRAPIALTGNSADHGVDTNDNGRYDVLTMTVEVYIQQTGVYTWNARLVDMNDAEFGWSGNSDHLSAGNNALSFAFNGRAISERQIDGPYYLKDLALWGSDSYVSAIQVAATSAYSYTQFEPPLTKVYLPVVLSTSGSCATIPTLLSPANGSSLDTIIPLFQWDNGNNPSVTGLRLEIAKDASFTQYVNSLWSGGSPGIHEFRFSHNLDPATTYYWRAWLMCGEAQGPYSEVWTFTTGSGGTILPAPALSVPANGSTLPSLPVTLQWSAVSGAEGYLVRWRKVGSGGYSYSWRDETQITIGGLSTDTTYEWWVSARNNYAVGADSATWQFTTPSQVSSLSPENLNYGSIAEEEGTTDIFEHYRK